MTTASDGGARSRRGVWMVVALVAVVAVVLAVLLTRGGDDGEAGSTAPLKLSAPTAAAGKCAVPSADFLRAADVAFEGTVIGIKGEQVTLEVRRWFRGGDDVLTVQVTGPSEQLRQVLSGVDFQDGERYLVTAVGGTVTMCGLSAPYSPEMAALYEEAFAE